MSHVVKIDGSKKTWPARLDGVEVAFPAPANGATLPEVVAFLSDHAKDDAAVAKFLVDAVRKDQERFLKSRLNSKAREKGKTYTRDEIKALPQRSAVISKEDAAAFGSRWKILPPKEGVASKLQAAEAAARREKDAREAANEALLDTLRALPKKDGTERLAKLVAAGVLPEGSTL